MTDATNIPTTAVERLELAAAVASERYGIDSPRALFFATLSAMLGFFLDHPDVPAPVMISAHCAAPSMLVLEQLAEHLGATIYGPAERPQFNVPTERLNMQIIVSFDARPERPL
jgi:hypothetical protein